MKICFARFRYFSGKRKVISGGTFQQPLPSNSTLRGFTVFATTVYVTSFKNMYVCLKKY